MNATSLPWLLLLWAVFLLAAATGHAQAANDCPAYSHAAAPGALRVPATTLGTTAGHYELGWLDPAIKTKKVLLLGENHWMNSVKALEEDIIFYANTKGSFPVLVLEIPYSATGYINAYIRAEPGSDAYPDVLKPLFNTKESVALLQHLRAWNAAHPDKQIQVACTDVEQLAGFMLKAVIQPYLVACGAPKLLAMVKAAGTFTDASIAYMDSVVRQSPAGFAVPDKPFLTKQFVQNVLANFQVSYQVFRQEAAQDPAATQRLFMAARQRQLLHNLTDDAFFGPLLARYNSILLGGASHMGVYTSTPATVPGEATPAEGWFLAQDFAPTKGRVYSIKLLNLSYKVPARYLSQEVKSDLSSYNNLVALYKGCPAISQRQGYRLLDGLTPLTAALLPAFRQNHDQPVWLPGQAAMTQLLKQSAALRQDPAWQAFYAHDIVIVLPTATLAELL